MNQEKVWNKISESWREFKTKISPAVENFLKDKKGKVLDVGCGSGRNFLKIDGLEWFGVDFSEKMLEYAKSNADKKGIKIELKKSKSSKLPYENNFFDCVLCVAVLHCIDSADERHLFLFGEENPPGLKLKRKSVLFLGQLRRIVK